MLVGLSATGSQWHLSFVVPRCGVKYHGSNVTKNMLHVRSCFHGYDYVADVVQARRLLKPSGYRLPSSWMAPGSQTDTWISATPTRY